MEIFLQIILLFVGFAMLIKGADWFVDGSSGIASILQSNISFLSIFLLGGYGEFATL